jgi:hypothetical protein
MGDQTPAFSFQLARFSRSPISRLVAAHRWANNKAPAAPAREPGLILHEARPLPPSRRVVDPTSVDTSTTAPTRREDADMTADASERAALRRRWEKATNWPLMVAAVVFLAPMPFPSSTRTCRPGCLTCVVG